MTDREKFEAWFKNYTSYDVLEHPSANVVEMMRQAWKAAIASQQPADDDWLHWNGERARPPVGDHVMVEVEFRDGKRICREAQDFSWRNSHVKLGIDIIAYRVVKP
ncbi:hypothetical protein [Leclercia sp.]|uniref:hypothetical protein n=1 Tax=Leclercia sp. TaxID=1898428 RepID=UPI0028ABCCAB|nr:hypothetical protein [Leclercia sp.]